MAEQKNKTRNKARDMIGDYYMTGREYDKQNRQAYKDKYGEGKQPWSKKEKVYLIISIAAAIAIILRYFVFR